MKIAHFSDLHVFDASLEKWSHFINKRLIAGINYLLFRKKHHLLSPLFTLLEDLKHTQPDHMVITGDVSNLGLHSEFLMVNQLLKKIDLPQSEITIIPGNHDNYITGCLKDFSSIFADYLHSDEEFNNPTSLFPVVKTRGHVAIIGISSAVVTPFFSSRGSIGNKQLELLEKALTDLSSFFRVVLIHHPPIAPLIDWRKKLIDKKEFLRIIQKVGCELILHGHDYKDQIRWIAGPQKRLIPMSCVGSASYLGSPEECARYNIYHIEDTRQVTVETRAFDPKEKTCYTFSQQILV